MNYLFFSLAVTIIVHAPCKGGAQKLSTFLKIRDPTCLFTIHILGAKMTIKVSI